MEIQKSSRAQGSGVPTEAQLAAINAQAKATLQPEQVYVFSVRLCDDQPDRDLERFDTGALPVLAAMFVGKTGIVDHSWSSDRQVARIFDTEVICEDGVSYIKAWAYIRRGGSADEVIADIEAGIKKEVSVGCAMGKAVCSVCGGEAGSCGHRKGEYYDGRLCCTVLCDPVDAYEFSFVAVPAQREAGVIKGLGRGLRSLKELAEAGGAQGEYHNLLKQAQLGQRYAAELQEEVVRLCMTLQLGFTEPVLRGVMARAETEDLLQMRQALRRRLEQTLPVQPQLPCAGPRQEPVESGYLI